jgi:sucrose phosphorylase
VINATTICGALFHTCCTWQRHGVEAVNGARGVAIASKRALRASFSEDLNLLSSQLLHSEQSASEIAVSESLDDGSADATATGARLDSSSCVLIAYADTVSAKDQPGLRCLQALLQKHFNGLSSVVHVLPFLRATSDGGFAVASHEEIEQRFGD